MTPTVVVAAPSPDTSASMVEVPLLSPRLPNGSAVERDAPSEAQVPLQLGRADEEVHSERSELSERSERSQRSEHSERLERLERTERHERLERTDHEDGHSSPRSALAAYTERLNTARVRAEFESSLLIVLTLNVLYTYYVDHKLIILFIRASQVVRLLYYPYASEAAQRGTALLVLISNVAVLFIHAAMMAQNEDPGKMLFINFIGPEPKSTAKIVFLDILIIFIQSILMQCRLDPAERVFLSMAPVPVQRVPVHIVQENEAVPELDMERERELTEQAQHDPQGAPT